MICEDNIFDNFCRDIFNKYPHLISFDWTQYTPYVDISSRFSTQMLVVNTGKEYDERVTYEILNFINKFDDNFYLNKFGDHVKITISKDDILVEEYEHE